MSVLFVGCLTVLAVGGGNNGGGQQAQDPSQDSGQGEGQAPASIGEEVVVGDTAYTVTNAQQETRLEDPSGFERPMTGNFLVVDFTVENRGDEPVSVSDIGLYVYDEQGRQFETEADVPLGYIPENKDLFLLDRINPGLNQDVRVVFSVPPDSQGYEMEVSSGLFATETRRISLGFLKSRGPGYPTFYTPAPSKMERTSMRISYDPHTDAVYVDLVDKPSVDSREVAPETVLDFDAEGNVVGIDIYGNAKARVGLAILATEGFEFQEVRLESWTGKDEQQ